jgi:glycosyltransferase involved in cell wall biosynthesis
MKMEIAVVIPAYNEQDRIGDTIRSLKAVGIPTIVVDDGSKDGTYKEAKRKSSYTLRHRINLGKGAAMKTGAEFAFENDFDAVIYFDADGQHDKSDIPKFVKKLHEGYDLVFGTRAYSHDAPLVRYIGNKFASLLVSVLFGIYVSDLICGFRAISRKGFKKIYWESTGYGVETEMVIRTSRTKLQWCEVPVETIYLDKVKGVTLLDAFGILFQVIKWRMKL